MSADKELREVPRMTDDELADVVRAVVSGAIFTSAQCPPDMIGSVFIVLGLGGFGSIDPESVGLVYEYMDKAGERGINGLPMFMSCKFIHKDDLPIVIERATVARAALDRAASGEK